MYFYVIWWYSWSIAHYNRSTPSSQQQNNHISSLHYIQNNHMSSLHYIRWLSYMEQGRWTCQSTRPTVSKLDKLRPWLELSTLDCSSKNNNSLQVLQRRAFGPEPLKGGHVRSCRLTFGILIDFVLTDCDSSTKYHNLNIVAWS